MNKVLIFCLLLVGIYALSGCKKEEEVIKIGFSYELTGANSELGRDAMNGALLAVSEINASGGINGKQIELIIKDDEGNPETGVENDNELIKEGCVAIIGHGTSNMGALTIANANENDFVLLSPTISSYVFDNIDDNFFRMIPSNDSQGAGIGEFINSHTPGDVIIFIENQNVAFTETVAASLQNYLETTELNYNENLIRFNSKDNDDYESVALDIANSDALNVVIIGSSYDVASILQKDLPDDKYIYIPVWASTSNIFDLSGDYIDMTHGINYFDLNSIEPKYLSFMEDYSKTYGIEASFSSMFSYESVYSLAEALKNATSFSTEDIKQALKELDEHKWLIDEVSFNDSGDIERKLYWFHLIDGAFQEVID